ncbi:putative chromosomal replication initiator protein [Azorhizobium caulinodans ORS 571]|uniref:Putative chromosomal replication initiator protein n=1 Tax=Azorhizobium caulinodans (strain ATCC 43989 / DSM 5975 / JCM 20966 / LMG 6465 / NBRC 14845 / NCIMB 13405 / ORS 571) TaxID=438753 RepID=A8I7K5_AZOC5|nr:helix-turn-helix domain-containing protein [Azorhizobium caulinodans]BAF88130.1 putative chromosomal replication initiator protein [Azorhizobium caulinodans ORS 571]
MTLLLETPEPSLRLIAAAVMEATGASMADIRSTRRQKEVVSQRHIVCWLAARLTGKTFRQIGVFLGGRDASTVREAVLRVEQRMAQDAALASRVSAMLAAIQALAAHGVAERFPEVDALAVAAHITGAGVPERAAIGASTDQIVAMAGQLMALHRAAEAAAGALVAAGGTVPDELAGLGYAPLQSPERNDGQ